MTEASRVDHVDLSDHSNLKHDTCDHSEHARKGCCVVTNDMQLDLSATVEDYM